MVQEVSLFIGQCETELIGSTFTVVRVDLSLCVCVFYNGAENQFI